MGVLPVEQNRKRDRLISCVKGIGISALLGVLTELLLLLAVALIVLKMGNFQSFRVAGICTAAALGGIVSGFFAAKRSKKNGLVTGAAAAFCTALLMWLAALIPDGASGTAVPLSAVICVIGGAVGGLIGVNLTYR